MDTGLLLLRIGAGIAFVVLFALKQSRGEDIFPYHPGRIWPLFALTIGALLVTFGFLTRPVACILAFGWTWALCTELRLGESAFIKALAIRSLQCHVFHPIAFRPGRFSIDANREAQRKAKQQAEISEFDSSFVVELDLHGSN